MGSQALPLQTKNGIFRNLPTFDPSVRRRTAIVTGANGISGFHTLRVLLESPERWSKIWAVSRRPPPAEMMELLPQDALSRVEHVACNFLSSPNEIASQLKEKNVSADAVFFYSYAQPKPKEDAPAWSNAQELCDVNTALLRNFILALDIASITPRRFLLQTGAKNYNIHQGPSRTPYVESDARNNIEPNFYYPQEEILFEYCQSHPATSWNIICPAWIIGATSNASMNALLPFAIYAATQAHKGESMAFPGVIESWMAYNEHSTAFLTGYLSEWAVLEEKCKNQKFNATDTSPLPHNRLWPELARWYGAKAVEKPNLDDSNITTIDPGPHGPTPLGYGSPNKIRFTWSLQKWASQPENESAWKEITQKNNLKYNPFEDIKANFEFGDLAIASSGPLSMNKARYFGWTGHCDTLESFHLACKEFGKIGMLPPMVVEKARPLV